MVYNPIPEGKIALTGPYSPSFGNGSSDIAAFGGIPAAEMLNLR